MARLVTKPVRYDLYATAGSGVLGLSYYFKHAFCLQYQKKLLELKRPDGLPVEPSEKLRSLVTEVTKELSGMIDEYTDIDTFIVPGVKTIHAGMTGSYQGGIVGLPAFFDFVSKEDIEKMVSVKKSVDGTFVESNRHCDCLLLSDKARKYVIAREMLAVDTIQVYIESVVPITVASICHHGLNYLNSQVGYDWFFKRASSVLVLMLGMVICFTIHKTLRNYFEAQVVDKVTQLGPEYVEGAIEYYTKDAQRSALSLELQNQEFQYNINYLFYFVGDKMRSLLSRINIPSPVKLSFYKSYIYNKGEPIKSTLG